MQEIVVEFWGDFACFTAPYSKVERMTYPAPTPTAAVGMLEAIYAKPPEFYWQINKIEVLHPIQYISFKRNEMKAVVNGRRPQSFEVDDSVRTQRQTIALKDVRYRVSTSIIRREECRTTLDKLYEQAIRRIQQGQCYYQPSLGLREFTAYFELSDGSREAVPVNSDMGLVIHDLWDKADWQKHPKCQTKRTLFHCVVNDGIIIVPPRGDKSILKGGN